MGVAGLIATIREYLAALLSLAFAKSIRLAVKHINEFVFCRSQPLKAVTETPRCIVGDQIRLLFVTGASLSLCISCLRCCVFCMNIFSFLV
ncbi:uncharacterized protein EDB91DRAFT_1115174 [Suillus paluster]|uniref:uncharacterized protein n=1 Tax=Suillus paluster TaxID=48578 RepID=UPI001B85FB96|nr:uncharacterized protein EDB91DRAFT_1115174 [Suillus paluster]KAG1747864.1 hypothetical protein EDB91DRAFT_1115174 [Suillus paluster]